MHHPLFIDWGMEGGGGEWDDLSYVTCVTIKFI